MPDASIDRRRLLGAGATMAAGAGLALTSPPALAQVAATAPTRPAYSPQPMPLPFAPGSIPGLSEKLLNSHHANNYVGAVKRIAAISGQIASLDPGTAPGFMLNGLKREELIATNSMILHELYFGNLGPAGTASPGLRAMLERDFGGVAQWQAQFGAMGKALGGGSGSHHGAGRSNADHRSRHVRTCLCDGLWREGHGLCRCGHGGAELDRCQHAVCRGSGWIGRSG
jgi:Fe-Mn family superoxide dismutase